jgi:RNA polymerase sigma-70 factor (ECF subfamily)
VTSGVFVDLSEQAWVDAASAGDVEAFNSLVLRYQGLVYNLAFRTLSDADDAADATQEAFFSAYRALASFRGGSFKSWLLRIAVNACYDVLRRRQRRPSDSLDAYLDQPGTERDVPDPAAGPEPIALTAETAAIIQEGLKRLSPDMRLAVVLCDVQGSSYEEAALALNIPVGTIKSRLSRARVQLRNFLAGRGELPGGSGRS